ncbi:hypothetical protein BDW22DRAFT_1360333 [Trametopsis cervina]|nr:hypothetical protein BDW22DRAFT_1360333 [Trametopsis cervina]
MSTSPSLEANPNEYPQPSSPSYSAYSAATSMSYSQEVELMKLVGPGVEAGAKVECDALLGHLLAMTLREAEHANEARVVEQVGSEQVASAPISAGLELLNECLYDVHELCDDPQLKQLVQACTSKKEQVEEWYPLLVELVNTAFDRLDTLQAATPDKGIARLREPPKGPQSVLLAQLAPRKAYGGFFEYKKSWLSPALALITTQTASRIYKGIKLDEFRALSTPRHALQHILCKQPDGRISWHELLSAFEVQEQLEKAKLRDPPSAYTVPAKMDPYTFSHITGNKDKFDVFNLSHEKMPGLPTAESEFVCRPRALDARTSAVVPSSSGSKRPASDSESSSQLHQSKRRRSSSPSCASDASIDETENPEWSYPRKMTAYASERLECLPVVTHSVSVLFKDDVFRLWWHDREGVIQTTGISFIQDLPRFLVFLLAIQRFNDVNWGVPLGFPTAPAYDCNKDKPNSPRHSTTTRSDVRFPASNGLAETTVTAVWAHPLCRTDQLCGRATTVYKVEYNDDTEAQRSFVMKVSYPEKYRPAEGRIIQDACNLNYKTINGDSPKNYDLKKHLPFVLCHMEVEAGDTSVVRKAVGLGDTIGRVLRVAVLEELRRLLVKGIDPKDFFRCWLETVHCHYLLWANGIEHTDPSLGNLRARIVGGRLCGVLNDFDLAIMTGSPRDLGGRVGTRPFMATDLLCAGFCEKGAIERVYRHDLEGFLWILAWVVLRLDESNDFASILPNDSHDLDCWNADSFSTVHVFRFGLFARRFFLRPQARWERPDAFFISEFVRMSLDMLNKRMNKHDSAQVMEHSKLAKIQAQTPQQDNAYQLAYKLADTLSKKYKELQFSAVEGYSSMQLEYLLIWATLQEALKDDPETYAVWKNEMDIDLDLPAASVAPELAQMLDPEFRFDFYTF